MNPGNNTLARARAIITEEVERAGYREPRPRRGAPG